MDYTAIFEAFIALVVAILSTIVIPYIKRKTDVATLEKINSYVQMFVKAAEQLYDIENGEEKKAYVISQLEGMGIIFDEQVIDAAIEAAVLELHNKLFYVYDGYTEFTDEEK